MPQYPLALGDLIIHDGGEYYAKILGGRGLPEVSPQMAARYNAWPVAQGVSRSPRSRARPVTICAAFLSSGA